MKKLLPLLILIAVLFSACASPNSEEPKTTQNPQLSVEVAAAPTEIFETEPAFIPAVENILTGCVSDGEFDEQQDYFPQKATITYTEAFSVEYHNNYKLVTITTPYPGAFEPITYVLVQCGTPAPDGFTPEQIIEVPVATVVSMSTSYLPALAAIDALPNLVGLDDPTYVSNATVLEMAADGNLAALGYGSGVNVEVALDLAPDLIITYGSGVPEYDAHPLLIEAGLKTVIDAEWLETSPLGRAEWAKFIALFFNKEAIAEVNFLATADRYTQLAQLAATAESKPTVFTASDYQGTWFMPGGNSFAAAFLKDAGADFLWANDPSTGSLPLAFESVYDAANAADHWINVGYYFSLDEIVAADARYADFAAFQNGNVWNNDARMGPTGGNDYYESAVIHPDDVLADLISIFHPELLPDHELVYYRQLK